MRYSRKLVALLLTVTFILGVTSCAKSDITRESFISGIESYGIEKTDDIGSLSGILMRRGGKDGYYVAKDKDDAQKTSNIILDRFDESQDFKATDFVLAALSEKGSDGKHYQSFAVYLALENDKVAKAVYDNLVDSYGNKEDGKTGTKSNVTYCIDSTVSAAGSNKIGTGVYLNGNKIVLVCSLSATDDDFKFVDKICDKCGLISPSKAG